MQYGKTLWKDEDYFHRGRAVGMLWEVGVAKAMIVGPGSLQLAHFAYVSLQGGNLQVLQGRLWRRVRAVRVPMPPADQALVMAEVKKDFMIWQSWSFVPTSVFQPMEGGLGYHDVLGFFADGGAQWRTPGLVTLEKKWIGLRGFESKLTANKEEVNRRFEALAEQSDITGQLFSYTKFSRCEVLQRGLEIMSPIQSWKTLKGQGRTKKLADLVPLFNKLRFFTAQEGPLQGRKVATISSFLAKAGRPGLAKHANAQRKVWLRKIPNLTASDVPKVILRVQSGGEGYCATKQTMAKIFPYL